MQSMIVNRKTLAPAPRAVPHACFRLAPDRHHVASRALARALASIFALSLAWPAPRAHADEKLARARNCYACHQVENKLVGPAWRDVANRYAHNPEAEIRLARKIREGGAGVWGVVAMAPNPAVSESDARALARWVLSLRAAK